MAIGTLNKRTAEITKKFMGLASEPLGGGVSTREFAELLYNLTGVAVSHQSVNNWLHGRYVPSTEFIHVMLVKGHGWTWDYAAELAKALAENQPARYAYLNALADGAHWRK